jgi:hypothetical protein
VRDFFRRLANEQPRAYGLAMLGIGIVAFSVCMLLRRDDRISYMLVLVTPVPFVYGMQSLVLGTTPEQLRADRLTSTFLLLLSLGGSVLLYHSLTR